MIKTIVSLSLLSFVCAQGPYTLVKTYEGATFFDDWVYFNNFDNLTNGDVVFVSQEVAMSSNLTFVNDAGNAIIKVDNSSLVVFNQKRNSVRISTRELWGVGSVWTSDILHAPFGCSVWPAWWSQAPTSPIGGEIDTFENVNLATTNQVSLHTTTGCNLDSQASFSGKAISTNCSEQANFNQGCIVQDTETGAFGASFSANGGGVFVTEYANDSINVWFFARSKVPSVLNDSSTTKLDTTTLGTPLASYDNKGCNITEFFLPQELIFDITLCGDFAGNQMIFNETCQGNCYMDFVIGSPAGYNDAFFEVRNVKVFQNAAAIGANSSSSGNNKTSSAQSLTKLSGRTLLLMPLLSGAMMVFFGFWL